MPGRPRTFAKCYITNAGHCKDWPPNYISSRVNGSGGRYQDKITNQTTHLVVSPSVWKSQGKLVKTALELNRNGGRDIKIVSFDWLDDSWRNGKKNEAPYEWERLEGSKRKRPKRKDQTTNDAPEKSHKKSSDKTTSEVEGAKSHVGMMAEVFQESTDKYLDAKEKKKLDKQVESQRRVQLEIEREEREARERENQATKAAMVFQKSAKKARNDIFSENYHVYTDSTGFKYDVTITKVDTKHNRNERYALTIYESNSKPHTYAMNAQFAKTATKPHNNIIATIGSPFPTTFHAFKKCFKEHTKIEWDKRISFAIERSQREKRNRRQCTGSDAGTQKGVPVSESDVTRNTSPEEDFATAPFLYHPPAYGPRGELPQNEMDVIAEIARPDSGKAKPTESEKFTDWISHDDRAESGPGIVDLTSNNGNDIPVDENQGFLEDMDRIFGDLQGQSSTTVATNTNNDEGFGEGDCLAEAFDYPFGSNDLYMPDVAPDQNDAFQDLSFNNSAGMPDSLEQDTQRIGETQLAERAHGELMEFVNEAKLDLGDSILGKRKTSPTEGTKEHAKSQKHADIGDSFGNESYVLDFTHGHVDDAAPVPLPEGWARGGNPGGQ